MTEPSFHLLLVWTGLIAGPLTAAFLLVVRAPYGRHLREGWGPTLNARLGWILMESPCVVVFLFLYLLGEHRGALVPLLFLALWQIHYLHRAWIYPFRIRSEGKRTPWLIVGMALVFTTLNSYINARWLTQFGSYGPEWLLDPRFVLGVVVFGVGLGINLQSDSILIGLRKPGQTGYQVPRGGLFRWVSCPNYLGEILEWTGWALATWSLPGLAFAVYTASNLAPRARSHHLWYREQFSDYPEGRRSLIPFVF